MLEEHRLQEKKGKVTYTVSVFPVTVAHIGQVG